MGTAISPGERAAEATWYNKGWKRWWFVLSINQTSSFELPNVFAALIPPNPPPKITTFVYDTWTPNPYFLPSYQNWHDTRHKIFSCLCPCACPMGQRGLLPTA